MLAKTILGITGVLFTLAIALFSIGDISDAGIPLTLAFIAAALYGYVNPKIRKLSFTLWVFAFLSAAMYYPFLFTDWGI